MDWARGGTAPEIIERDDGFMDLSVGHELYVAEFKDWPLSERRSMRYVRGRVLDVGCGAGRVTLYLQRRGFDVVGLDASPLAVRSARLRGVKKAWCLSIDELSKRIGPFDTIALLGNNFGFFGTPQRLRRMLGVWARRTNPTPASWPRAQIHIVAVLRRLIGVITEEQKRGPYARTVAYTKPLPRLCRCMVKLALRVTQRDAGTPEGHRLAPGQGPRRAPQRFICCSLGERLNPTAICAGWS